jgi:hypothetical protein
VSAAGSYADCPPGTLVHSAGGGGSITDSGPVYLQVVYPYNDLRRVETYMTSTPAGGMVVSAVCAP